MRFLLTNLIMSSNNDLENREVGAGPILHTGSHATTLYKIGGSDE